MALEPGLGKTRIALWLIHKLFGKSCVLLIVPGVVHREWITESNLAFGPKHYQRIVILKSLKDVKMIPQYSKEAKIIMMTPELFSMITALSGSPEHPNELLPPGVLKGKDLWNRFCHATFVDECHLQVGLFTNTNWALFHTPVPIFGFTGKFRRLSHFGKVSST